MKITDPDAVVPPCPLGTDVRVLLPAAEQFSELREKILAEGIPVRSVQYLVEQETISTLHRAGALHATVAECGLSRQWPRPFAWISGAAANAARDAFELMWDGHAPVEPEGPGPVPAAELVSTGWVKFLPYPMLNPAQVEAVPYLLGRDDHLVVVAPTGAGKTVIGMIAALRTIMDDGRKAAWLVPQRSLTDELDRELEAWRGQGLRVERLSGEYSVDVQRARDADLWVVTTEKFEAICRTASLREALAEVGCLIVDEIHLLGDPARGPVLEAVLARVRARGPEVRIVGLSATVSNAGQVAEWMRARLVRIAWRPNRLTWQLPVVAAHHDWTVVEASRTRLATALTRSITADQGSVLVFCGSKRGVRRMALVVAADRGVDTRGVHPDDLGTLHQVCEAAGVGLHYKGWEHSLETERRFRDRELQVLVATSTVAAGVNLPARAVVVRDTEVGFNELDAATAQQMFGRAGRVGAGENQGWAFLIVDDAEHAAWQRRLVAGYTVRSQIQSSLPDHVLGEAVQQSIRSPSDAERWWVRTLAHHQGNQSRLPLRSAVESLIGNEFLTELDGVLEPTELGLLTARMMVSTSVGHALRQALAQAPLPVDADEAERTLITVLCTRVPKLLQASVPEEFKAAIAGLLAGDGRVDAAARQDLAPYAPGDLAQAALLAVAVSPSAFHRGARQIGGIPYASMYPVLEEAPRYLHWIGTQGPLGTVPPWAAIVAADLGRRVRWRRCRPGRGSGRLLWMCEQMATPAHVDSLVVPLWTAATDRNLASPDWAATGRPQQCRLDDSGYAALLRDRATDVVITAESDRVAATGPVGSVLVTWTGTDHDVTPLRGARAITQFSRRTEGADRGAAVFTWRGDYRATGWLAEYSQAALPSS